MVYIHGNGEKIMLFQFTKKLAKNFKELSSISLICSKNFKRLLYKKIFDFFLDKDLISGNPSSLKPTDSFINQLLLIMHDIYISFDDGYEFRGVFLDISKAFDKLWLDDLIFKLEDNGISGVLRYYD